MRKQWIPGFSILILLALLSLLDMPSTEAATADPNLDGGDTAWMLAATGLVLLMTPGLSFFYGGMVSKKSVISTMLQSFICMGIITLVWVVCGFSLAFGDSIGGFIGDPTTFAFFKGVGAATQSELAPTIPFVLFALFQMKFAIITPALITGSFAERVRFSSFLLFIILFSIIIYSPLAHMTWHPEGFLRKWGVLDFAGGTVVHMSAGFAAIAAAIILGRRKNHGTAVHQPANVPYVLLGTGLLWFGWFGFNAGSALGANGDAALAFATTTVASAAAMLAWVFYDALMGRKISGLGASIGAVVGLVAITPAAGFVTIGQSVFIGVAGAIVSNIVVYYKNKTGIDDTLDVFPCHGVGGIVGMILTGVFAKDVGLIYGDPSTFLKHMAAIFLVGGFTFGLSYLLFKVTNAIIPMRVTEQAEDLGLDISQHNESIVVEDIAAEIEGSMQKAS
ncbi:ammonium transporter [Roseivirga pacifica]|uniref:ammonium transporter n=1 Tax=Roseivirga pacifica TaxID=1267423 RepID=UPI0020943B16|nr:ammonium transporter [Roseivirga pacifica]MCO6359529.1 ammonium transporter [Roseivirga pacifica]MCO6366899.1 ammonium transporter [Roseivirga pacifica]MCO6370569.1 ammonium transporter [Roseivirga pacifica]MCO6374556.1 ammonium transporter [Roseivirga pacifica]MCO6379814.1 ammonium transporter [Roseivirga pacifica]